MGDTLQAMTADDVLDQAKTWLGMGEGDTPTERDMRFAINLIAVLARELSSKSEQAAGWPDLYHGPPKPTPAEHAQRNIAAVLLRQGVHGGDEFRAEIARQIWNCCGRVIHDAWEEHVQESTNPPKETHY